jgi:drug/metabolite transporter (DMT)-like permease
MLRGAIYGCLAAAIWGGMYVVSDVVLRTIPPFPLLTIRLILGAVVLGFATWRMRLPLPKRRTPLRVLGVGIVGFGISVGAQFVGTDRSTAVNGALITSASPAFILIFAALILREPLTLRRILAIALATVGVVVIVDPSQADFSSDTFFGNIALIIAALTWGLYSVLVKKVSEGLDTLLVTLIAFFGGMIITIPASFIELGTRPIGTITPLIILGVLYLGVVSTAAAMWLWNRAFALVDASLASLFFFAQPLVGALLSVIFLHQPMTPALWIGSVLILLGVLLSLIPTARPVAALSPE